VKSGRDTVPFHPYYTIKDFFAVGVFCIPFAWLAFFAPDILGTPTTTSWRTRCRRRRTSCRNGTSAILRDPARHRLNFILDSKLLGVIFFGGSILILFFVPWLDTSKVRSALIGRRSSGSTGVRRQLPPADVVRRAGAGLQIIGPFTVADTSKLSVVYYSHTSSSSAAARPVRAAKPLPNSISESVLAKPSSVSTSLRPSGSH